MLGNWRASLEDAHTGERKRFAGIISWFVYFINRYRRAGIKFSDLVMLIGIIVGGAILTIFLARTDLFGAYGIGLFAGFFDYYLAPLIKFGISRNLNVDWSLHVRRIKCKGDYEIPLYVSDGITPMEYDGLD